MVSSRSSEFMGSRRPEARGVITLAHELHKLDRLRGVGTRTGNRVFPKSLGARSEPHLHFIDSVDEPWKTAVPVEPLCNPNFGQSCPGAWCNLTDKVKSYMV